jgi:hypothetical protein
MKHPILLLSLFSIVIVSCGQQQTNNDQIDKQELLDRVEFLASDSLKGRDTGSEGERIAADYIIKEFSEAGLSPMGDEQSFLQEFTFVPKSNPHVMEVNDSTSLGMGTVKEIKGNNVIAFLDKGSENTVVIGAHYDHLGMGSESSLYRGEAQVHNGADDNASGVAVMIELAERLKEKPSNNNYLFIAFSGEEKGLWGSNYYCKNPTYPLEKVNYMINMDMVGRLKEERTLAINGVGTSPIWMETIESIDVDSIQVVTTESGVGPSDHTSFYLQDIPVLHFFTGQHEDYHKPSDDVDKINVEGMLSVTEYIEVLIEKLDDKGELEFTKTKDQDNDDTPRFTVTLGVIPDYLFSGNGMRIDGVSEGKVAQKAGMQKGDIVVKMGDVEVVDMMSYMDGLGQYESGDSTLVKVRRGEEIMEFSIVFD